jgi:hypothetical protein
MEQFNLLMNDESYRYSKSQRPKDPDRLKNCLKRKGINLDDEDDKENNPTEPPLPPRMKRPQMDPPQTFLTANHPTQNNPRRRPLEQ